MAGVATLGGGGGSEVTGGALTTLGGKRGSGVSPGEGEASTSWPKMRAVTFTLVVDNFGIKYVGERHLQHLLSALRDLYTISTDATGTHFLVLKPEWDYDLGTVTISMPGYVQVALTRFQHALPSRRQASPHAWTRPIFGQRAPQLAPSLDATPPLLEDTASRIRQIVGVFLYYAVALDCTMLVALGTLASQQNAPTEQTMTALVQFLDYAALNPSATITYHTSGMCLHFESDASYLSAPAARSRAVGLFYLGAHPDPPGTPPDATAAPNGIIHVLCHTLGNVMSSAMEA